MTIPPLSTCNMIPVLSSVTFCLSVWLAGPLARSLLNSPGSGWTRFSSLNSSISFRLKTWMKLYIAQSAGEIQAFVGILYSGECTNIMNCLLRTLNIYLIAFQAWACWRLYISFEFCGLPSMRRAIVPVKYHSLNCSLTPLRQVVLNTSVQNEKHKVVSALWNA